MNKKSESIQHTQSVAQTPIGISKDPFDLVGSTIAPEDPSTNHANPLQQSISPFEVIENDEFDEQRDPEITIQLLWSYRSVILVCLMISFGGFLFGWDTGSISGIIALPSFEHKLGNYDPKTNDYHIGTVVHGLLVGCYHIGCIIGGFTLVRLSDFKGRRLPILICLVIYITGNTIQATTSRSGKWYQFMIGRFVSGLCIGSLGSLLPIFISELSPAVIRGSLTTLYLLLNTTGIMLGAIVIYLLKNAFDDNTAWIICLCVPIGVAMLVFIGILKAPESARFLISIGDIDGATKSLKRIGESNIEETIASMQAKFAVESKADEMGYFQMLTNKRYTKRLFTGVMVMFLQQMSGIDYFFYFGTQLFFSVGLNDSYVTMIILATVNYFTTWAVMYVVERFGRKKTLLVGSAACFSTLMVYAIVGVTMVDLDADASGNRTPGYIMITFTCIYIIVFGCTWAGCGQVVVTEMFPLQIRSKGVSVSIAFNWGANFFIAFCTPIVTAEIHYYFGLVFAGCMFVSFWFVLFFVPETKGISLEEIDGLYEKKGQLQSDNV
ncbi:Hexose transporter 2 [Cyberlindnera fabianii]|uniref:Hexose transporter 2 n=1 Tax=Cyberlindnera fabianii TaxID=36022 RepID=A0A1V2L8H5_CYBFA|nr:Hexose transporter 2 [Cyberlindnera fabianii]